MTEFGIEPNPLVFQTNVRTSYTTQSFWHPLSQDWANPVLRHARSIITPVDRMGIEPITVGLQIELAPLVHVCPYIIIHNDIKAVYDILQIYHS